MPILSFTTQNRANSHALYILHHHNVKGFWRNNKKMIFSCTSHVLLTTREEILSYLITHKKGQYKFNTTPMLIAVDRVMYFLIGLRLISVLSWWKNVNFNQFELLLPLTPLHTNALSVGRAWSCASLEMYYTCLTKVIWKQKRAPDENELLCCGPAPCFCVPQACLITFKEHFQTAFWEACQHSFFLRKFSKQFGSAIFIFVIWALNN